MKSLINTSGGVPVLLSDLVSVLQDSTRDAVYSYYSSLTGTTFGNKGIIIKSDTITWNGLIHSTDFTNWRVFLNGKYLTPAAGLLNTVTSISNSTFYLVEAATITESRTLRTNTTATVAKDECFTFVTALPPLNQQYITFETGYTNRTIATVSRNSAFPLGTILQTANISAFNTTTGLGSFEWDGWALCNGLNGTVDLRGSVALGLNPASATTPATAPTPTQENYGLIGNKGGIRSNNLTIGQLPVFDQTYPAVSYNIPTPVRLFGADTGGTSNALRADDGTSTDQIFVRNNQVDIRTRVQFGNGDPIDNRLPYTVTAFVQRIS